MIRLKWFASKLLPQILYECTSTSIPLKFSSKAAFIDLFKLEYPQILFINSIIFNFSSLPLQRQLSEDRQNLINTFPIYILQGFVNILCGVWENLG